MKNIILFALLIAASYAFAQTNLELQHYSDCNGGFVIKVNDIGPCKAYESITAWEAEKTGDTTCKHCWAYATVSDVNNPTDKTLGTTLVCQMLDLVYRPCGSPTREKEARICRLCLRHESRTREWGFKYVEPPKSEYKTLLEKIKN